MSRRGSLSCPQTSPPSSTSKIKIITRLKFTASPNETASKDYKPNGNTSRGGQPRAKHSKPEQHRVHCNNFSELAMLINNQTMQRRVSFFPPLYSRASTCSPGLDHPAHPNAPLSTKTIRILDHQVQPAGPLSTTSSSPSAAAAADRRETNVGVDEGEGDRRPRDRSRARARTRCTSCALGDADRSRTGRVGVLCSNECMNVWKGPSHESTTGDVTDDGGDEVRGGVKEPGCNVCLVSS